MCKIEITPTTGKMNFQKQSYELSNINKDYKKATYLKITSNNQYQSWVTSDIPYKTLTNTRIKLQSSTENTQFTATNFGKNL